MKSERWLVSHLPGPLMNSVLIHNIVKKYLLVVELDKGVDVGDFHSILFRFVTRIENNYIICIEETSNKTNSG